MELLGTNTILTALGMNLTSLYNPPELSSHINYNKVPFSQFTKTLAAVSGDQRI
jgi:hypothetical protein